MGICKVFAMIKWSLPPNCCFRICSDAHIVFCMPIKLMLECSTCNKTTKRVCVQTWSSRDQLPITCSECIEDQIGPIVSFDVTLQKENLYDSILLCSMHFPHKPFSIRWALAIGKQLIRFTSVNQLFFERSKFAKMCVDLLVHAEKQTKMSLDMFCLCLIRLGIYKDLRQLLVKMIWPNEIICWSGIN